MSRVATSILAWGIYLLAVGPALMIRPNALLAVGGMPPADDVWIRVVGMLLFLLGFYYILAARAELTAFFRGSVWVRGAVLPILACFVAAGLVKPIILLIGVVDLSGAIWTAVAQRRPSPGEPSQQPAAGSMKLYDRLVDSVARTRAGSWIILHPMTALDRRLMRWSKGRVNMGIGSHLGPQTLLLTTVGRRSGRERAVPVLFTRVGEELVVVASRGGHAKNPAWYHNLKVQPACRVVYGGHEAVCTAHEAEGEERERLWTEALATYGGYADYAALTERRLPAMVLTPTGSG